MDSETYETRMAHELNTLSNIMLKGEKNTNVFEIPELGQALFDLKTSNPDEYNMLRAKLSTSYASYVTMLYSNEGYDYRTTGFRDDGYAANNNLAQTGLMATKEAWKIGYKNYQDAKAKWEESKAGK